MAKKVLGRPKHLAMSARTAPRTKKRPDTNSPLPPRGHLPISVPPQASAAGKHPLFPIVGVGASAGGLEAFTAFLKHLRDDSGMAFVLIQHLDPTQHSQLTDLLAKATRMPIREVAADVAIEPNHVYVMAPGVCLRMSDGHIRVEERGTGKNLPIDFFLRSLASDNTSKAIGIVLSGTASDGTLGLKAVKAEGGVTFAQEPSSAKFDGMPRSAIAAGVVDFVLEPGEIAARLTRLAQHPFVEVKSGDDSEAAKETESALNRIFHLLRTVTGNDFTHYKHSTIRRRIHRRMVLHASEKPDDYIAFLQENPAEARALADDLLICVTSFFREPEALKAMAATVFPEILKGKASGNSIRIWVPGCATGEEAYSVAICLTEFLERAGANVPVQMFASDLSERSLEKARAGIYGMPALAGVSPARLKRFFVKVNGGYQIAKSIRESCIFARQNIAKDPPFHNLDLITCCNVLIYFGPVLQRKALATFHYALKPGGFLMLGPSESVGPLPQAFLPLDKKLKLYSKLPGLGPLNIHLMASESLETRHPGAAAAGGTAKVALDVQKTAERMLLAQYAPASVIVDDALNVVHVRGDTGAYLQLASGEPTYSLLKMAREGLVVGLRMALLKARQKKAIVNHRATVRQNGQLKDVNLKVVPIDEPVRADARHFMVLFETVSFEGGAPASVPAIPEQDDAKQPKGRLAQTGAVRIARENTRLKQEMAATREYLQSIIEEQEASTEELKSSNEEAQATNEELETAKEELQSSNEELNTVNDELKTRNLSLTEVNSDLSNVLASINVPLLMVGKELNIRRFTESMVPMLNLIDSDIGRSISDLKPNIDVPDLPELLRAVITGGKSSAAREIQDPKGNWYYLQALPYRAPDNKIDGALLVMSDIDAIRHARDYAEAIVETVRQPVVVLTEDLKVTSANQAFYETFLVSSVETEGRSIYDLGSGQWNISKLREALERILPKGGSFQDFEVSRTFDGIGRRTMLLSARQLTQVPPYGHEKILLAIDDITARREAEETLRESEERYRTLFDLGPVAVYSCDASGMIRDFNLRAAELWGRAPKPGDSDERFCGSHRMRLPNGAVMPHDKCPMAEVLSGKIPEARDMQVQIERPDGSRIIVLVNIRALKNELGEITGAINCFADITAAMGINAALRKTQEGLRRANDDLQHFAYAASHDLQEPLRMVTNYTQLLSREYKGKLDKDADQFIAYAVEGAYRMDALLKGMREYWQAGETGKERHVEIDCNEVLKKTLLNLQETVKNSGASVTHDSLPIVQAEEVMLVQLLQNLIGNAIKYRSKKTPQVHVSAEKTGKEEWLFSVRDNGIGIDPLYAEKIFDMFSRLNGNKHPGSGIGLAICRKVVERLGGRIWVESKPGGGADFRFTIPPGARL